MPPLQPLQQTVFEQGPQTSVGIGASPIVDYREDPTVIVNPINPALALDNGVAWYALGAEAFNVAGKLYGETLDNVIESKDASIQAISYDLQNKTDDFYQGFQIRLKQAEIAGTDLTQEDQEILNKNYEDIKTQYADKARGVLGPEDYDRFTKGSPDLSDLGSKYRRLALQTRKSYYDIENNINKVMYEMASQQQQLVEQLASKARFVSGNKTSRSGQPPMTKAEIAANIPVFQIAEGNYPITDMPKNKDGTEFGRDTTGQILNDEKGQPLLIKRNDGLVYINPLADKQGFGEEGLTNIARADSAQGNLTDDTGNNIHPEAQSKFKALLEGRLSKSDAFITMNQLRYIDVSTLVRLAGEDGGKSFTADDILHLSIFQNMSRNSATQEQLIKYMDNTTYNPKAIEIANKYLNSLKRGSKTMVMEGRINQQGSEEKIYGTGEDQKALATITNEVVKAAALAASVDLDTYLVDENGKDKIGSNEGDKNESIVDFLDRNPQMKITIMRAYLAVQANPSIIKGGTNDTDIFRSNQIIDFIKDSFIPAEFEAASLSVFNGKVISSRSLYAVEKKIEGMKGIITSSNITDDMKKTLFESSKEEKRKLFAQADLLNTNGSTILDTDSTEIASKKMEDYVGELNPAGNKQVISTVIGGIGQTQSNHRGNITAKNGLNDGQLARIAVATNPIFYGPMGLVPNTPDAAAKVRAMSVDDQLILATKAWKLIPSGEHWQIEFDYSNMEQLEGDNSGIPIGFSAIPAKTTTGTNINLVDYITSKDNLDYNRAYMFRHRDNNSTPIFRIGQKIKVNDQLFENSERNIDKNIKDIIEARSEDSKDDRTISIRGVNFPARTDTKVRDDVRSIDSISNYILNRPKENFDTYFKTKGVNNPEITSVVDLINQLDLPATQAAKVFLRNLDPDFKDDIKGTNILDTITKDYRQATQPNTGELRTGSGEGKFTDTFFTPAVMDTVYAKGQALGLKTVSDYLSLLFEVARGYRNNSEYDQGYNLKEYRNETSKFFNGYRPNPNGDTLEEVFPDTIPMGPKAGMILWDENSLSFVPVLEGLIESGSSIYTKKGTSEYYAFENPPASSDYVLYHSSSDKITPAIEATPDTRVTTTERVLTQPVGGWNGWGPMYDNVTKTTGTKGMSAQAATGKTTDLTKAFEKNRLHRLFVSEAGNDSQAQVPKEKYKAEAEFKAIQSDISRILSESWKKFKSEMGRLPVALAEIPARLGKAIDEIPAQLEGQMDQAGKAIDAIPSQLAGQMDNAKNAIARVPSQVAEIFKSPNVASGPDLGYMAVDAINNTEIAGQVKGQVENAKNAVSRIPSQIAEIFKSPNVANPDGFDFGWWAMDKMKEPIMAAMLAAYKESGSTDFSFSPKIRGIALRAAFYSFFGMDEDVVDNLSHEQTLELQKTVEAAPPSKIKNITLTAIKLLHEEHMAEDGDAHDTTKNQRYITAPVEGAPKKDYVTEANYNFTATQPSPGAVAEPKNRPDVELPTVVITRSNFPVKVNADGSVSTIVSMSFQAEKDGPEILIPTVVGGKQLTEKQAKDRYFKTGEHFGKFSTVEKANAYAEALHLEEEKSVSTNEKLWFDLIKTYEGFKSKAYNKDGKWTVGAGSTTHPDGTPVKKGDVIDAAKADMYVRYYTYNTVIPTLSNTIPSWNKMNPNQQAALISFAYNMGPNFYGAPNRETITAALKSPLTWYKIPTILPLYNKATSQTSGKLIVLQGLIKRRQAEANLWKETK